MRNTDPLCSHVPTPPPPVARFDDIGDSNATSSEAATLCDVSARLAITPTFSCSHV